jgi:hypothetical protein
MIPISLGNRTAADPNLADLAIAARFKRVRVDDANFLIAQRAAAAHQRLRVRCIG